jgi:twitching motility protein PilJ
MSLTTDERQLYQQAVSAFIQGNYEDAKALTQELCEHHPQNPNIHLLRGHILIGMKQYQDAQFEYQIVLETADGDGELLECAQNSLNDIEQFLGTIESRQGDLEREIVDSDKLEMNEVILSQFPQEMPPEPIQASPIESQAIELDDALELQPSDPVLVDSSQGLDKSKCDQGMTPPPVYVHHTSNFSEFQEGDDTLLMNKKRQASSDPIDDVLTSMENHTESEFNVSLSSAVMAMQDTDGAFNETLPSEDDLTLDIPNSTSDDDLEALLEGGSDFDVDSIASNHTGESSLQLEEYAHGSLDEILSDSSEALPNFGEELSVNMNTFLYEEDESQEDLTSDLSWSPPPSNFVADQESDDELDDLEVLNTEFLNNLETPEGLSFDDEEELESSSTEIASADPQNNLIMNEPSPTAGMGMSPKRNTGILAPFVNASFQKKQLMMALATGTISAAAVVGAGQIAGGMKPSALGLGAASAGVAGGLTTLLMGQIVTRQLKRSTNDLQAQLAAVAQGDWTVKATEFSGDEFGQLARSFNEMTQYIESSTQEVQQKAEDQEKAKEDLQRQVIRLLDDVEGAARGDLTVQAEVTADILGAVADSFNLTIYNLQKIVKQVKVAAREVSYGAAENEEFARGLSSDALKQAEELAATLNSVQMMTNSIQEVAQRARSADQVAQKASETALRGGLAVEQTVSGILQIRETVAETTRKVKRLAESSQEISKIVGFISQIASRTNLLALNASIEAARAGESGRGFAVVADEVRQLADRASKASKEIEQIVLQIQGETSSVMTAMEEGTQQVIDGTQKAEQAKRSLDDIIQVSSQINQLVGSITQATEEQTETSRYVAQVMQSVELTAQETSQESQRVSDSLRNLVGVARDLQSSVERFKVEGTEVS